MIAISKVQEELENVRRAVLVEANEGLDAMNKFEYDILDMEDQVKLHNIESNLREILRIMSR